MRCYGTIVSCGIIDKETGDILQIAVDENFRSRGVATSLLSDLIKNTESSNITMLNIDSRMKPMLDFLTKLGFKNYVTQYEMILYLNFNKVVDFLL